MYIIYTKEIGCKGFSSFRTGSSDGGTCENGNESLGLIKDGFS